MAFFVRIYLVIKVILFKIMFEARKQILNFKLKIECLSNTCYILYVDFLKVKLLSNAYLVHKRKSSSNIVLFERPNKSNI